MSQRLTSFADTTLREVDMQAKLEKRYSQHLQKEEKIEAVLDEEVVTKMGKYNHTCDFVKAECKEHFKTKSVMHIHCCSYNFNYTITKEKWEVEKIKSVFGRAERKIFLG